MTTDTDTDARSGRRGRFLITTWEGGGNVPPAVALGVRLSRRGHDVRLMGSRSLGGVAAEAGLDWTPHSRVPAWPKGVPLDSDFAGLREIINGRAAAEDVAEELHVRPVDVLVADCMSGASMAAGAAAGVSMAILVHVLYAPFAEWGAGTVDLDGPRRVFGLEPLPGIPFGERLATLGRVLCLTPPGLDGPSTPIPENRFYVGPVLSPDPPAEPWSRRGDAPVLLLSFSTTLMQQADALPPILQALAPLPVQGVLTLGGVLAPEAIDVPANFTVSEFTPHAAILPHASVVVTHGGLSTITTALAFGVPLVCIPQGRDQSLNSERVAATGVGIHVSADAPPAAIAGAVTAVLEDGRYRAAAAAMAESIRLLGRGEEAARLTEELLV